MLKNYSQLALKLEEKIRNIKFWPEIEFNTLDKDKLSELDQIVLVNNHSLRLNVKDNNHVILPSQYILYAICIKELALAVKEYLDVFENLKLKFSKDDICDMIINKNMDFSVLNLDDYSSTMAAQIFLNPDFNLGAKSIVNGDKSKGYVLRGTSDFFGSIILKPINIPNASSSILGKLVFNLCENKSLYSYLESRFLNKTPYIIKDSINKNFCKSVISFIYQYDQLAKIKHLIIKNSKDSFSSIKHGNFSLTTIFKTSNKLLLSADLRQGNDLRFFEEPLFMIDNEYYYFSTEWTNIKTGRLDLQTLSHILNIYYPEFSILEENNVFSLKSSSEESNFSTGNSASKFESQNTIYYGPPGTGKTYTTKEAAVRITNPDFITNLDINFSPLDKRTAIVKEYDRLFDSGQIVFTTFHQSMSYEDFIEGIKPIAPVSENSSINYKVENGIFKNLCKTATEKKGSVNFDDAYSLFVSDVIENGTIELTSLIQKKPFKVRINSNETAVAIPNTEIATEMGVTKDMLREYVINGIVKDWKTYTTTIGEYLKSNYKISVQHIDNTKNNYVLIIDEINRGNVSSIFGELITLLESDKRIGEPEQIALELPYSKNEKFGIPSNLYIIGTMNTADRSVEALDTALRRRFSFVEIMPKPELLEEIKFTNFNLSEVLKTINERIEVLLDRDHTIGHSYFLKIRNGDTESLKSVFKNNIFPLLQEYFYHDYEKIALILGEGFVRVKENQTVKFAKFNTIDAPEVSTQFELVDTIEDIEVAVQLLLNRNV